MKKAIEGGKCVFTFDGLDAVVLDVAKASATVRDHAMMHGFLARIGDNAALSRKQKDGSVVVITEAMRREAVAELVGHYESGTESWETRTVRVAVQNPRIVAIAQKRGCTYAEAEAWFAAKLAAELDAA